MKPEPTSSSQAKRAALEHLMMLRVSIKRIRDPWWHPTEKLWLVPVDTETDILVVKVRSEDWKVVDCAVGDVWRHATGVTA